MIILIIENLSLLKKSLVDIIDFGTVPNTDRACAIEITYGNNKLMCVNMYMHINNQRKTYVDIDMIDTIESTEIFIENSGITRVIIVEISILILVFTMPMICISEILQIDKILYIHFICLLQIKDRSIHTMTWQMVVNLVLIILLYIIIV